MRGLPPLDRFALATCCVAGLAARVLFLGRDDVSPAEAAFLSSVAHGDGGIASVPTMLARAIAAAGATSSFAMRLPFALLGAAMLVPAFALLRRALPETAARWALAVLAVHPAFVFASREAGPESMFDLAFIGLLFAAHHALGAVGPTWPAAAALVAGLCIHPSWAMAALPVAIWILVERHRGGAPSSARAWPLVAATFVLAACFAFPLERVAYDDVAPPIRDVASSFAARAFAVDRAVASPAVPLALIAWAICCVRGVFEEGGRGARMAMTMLVMVPFAGVVAVIVRRVTADELRVLHVPAYGFTMFAALAAVHSARVQARIRAQTASGGGGVPPWVRSLLADPVGVPWLVAALAVWTGVALATPRTAWSAAAADVRRDVPADAVVWTSRAGDAAVLSHHAGRPVLTAPRDGTDSWRAWLDTSVDPPVVRVTR